MKSRENLPEGLVIIEPLISPTAEEVKTWILGTIRHVINVEYFLHLLELGKADPERPHDLVGPGNKLEWDVIKGFAVQYRSKDPTFFNAQVRPSLVLHRQQYHHTKWNEANPLSTEDDLRVGAIDALSSLMGSDRVYQGGAHSPEQILQIIEKNPPHKRPWLKAMLQVLMRVQPLDLKTIINIHKIANPGVPQAIIDGIQNQIDRAVISLKERNINI